MTMVVEQLTKHHKVGRTNSVNPYIDISSISLHLDLKLLVEVFMLFPVFGICDLKTPYTFDSCKSSH